MVGGSHQRNVKSPPIFRYYTFIYKYYILLFILNIYIFSRIKSRVKNRYEILVKV